MSTRVRTPMAPTEADEFYIIELARLPTGGVHIELTAIGINKGFSPRLRRETVKKRVSTIDNAFDFIRLGLNRDYRLLRLE